MSTNILLPVLKAEPSHYCFVNFQEVDILNIVIPSKCHPHILMYTEIISKPAGRLVIVLVNLICRFKKTEGALHDRYTR